MMYSKHDSFGFEFLLVNSQLLYTRQSFLPHTPLRLYLLLHHEGKVHDEAKQLLLAGSIGSILLPSLPPTFHHFTGDLRGQSRPPTLFAPVPSDTVVSSDSNSSASPFFHRPLPSFSFLFSATEGLFVPPDKDIYVARRRSSCSVAK